MVDSHPPVVLRWLGRRPYAEAWELQRELVAAIGRGEAPETLLLVEHDPVITLGRKAGAESNVLAAGEFPVVAVERGGDATYHGPGQLVGYPLLRLREGEQDLHAYLRRLEELMILVLADYGLEGSRKQGLTGVWVQDRKVVSLGVAVRKWVTYHGFGLNVSTDLGHFDRLNPCGLTRGIMTSMEALAGRPIALDEVVRRLERHLPETLGRTGVWEATAQLTGG